MVDFHRTASTSSYLVKMSIFVGDMIDSFLAYMIDLACLTFACDEDDVENVFDLHLYQGCFFADIWNQETRNSRSLSRSF